MDVHGHNYCLLNRDKLERKRTSFTDPPGFSPQH